MRTLVISDLHLGSRLAHDALRQPAARRRLREAVSGAERLVLLGDIVELVEARAEDALRIAEPILRELAGALGPRGEVILVPGNHDLRLIGPWVRAQGRALAVDAEVPVTATPRLARVASWFQRSRFSVRYPGVWLSDRVWATHGHYLSRHLLPESTFGVARESLRRPAHDAAVPADYERRRVTGAAALQLGRWLPRPLAAVAEALADRARAATMPRLPTRLLPDEMAPVTSRLLAVQFRHAGIPAMARVAQRLGIDAEWVIFGHLHRLGPLPDDDPRAWQAPGGRPRIVNSGSWIYERRLLHRAGPDHRYWPGGAVWLDQGGAPEPVRLLDGIPGELVR